MNKLNLNSEEKCGYFVSENMKKVWQTELDILEQIMKICDKYHIQYFADGGTALGAVRHHGFIPWDDDIDLMMLRKDYDKFMDIAVKELKEPYFCQCYKTEKNYYRGHIQVRKSDTTAIIAEDKYNNYNKGIWVDIFPLDNVPNDLRERKKFIKKIIKRKKIIGLSTYVKSPNFLKSILKWIIANIYWKIFNVEKAIINLEEFVKKYNHISTEYCKELILCPEYYDLKNSWFLSEIQLDFEYLNLPVVKDYNEQLEELYGENYMAIPDMKPNSMHGNAFFDTEKSYTTYSKNEIEEIINSSK